MKTVKMFPSRVSLFDANGEAEKYINNKIKIASSKWKETTGVMCGRNIPTKLNDKVNSTAINPAMVYGAERWELGRSRRRKRTKLKCACCGLQEERQDVRNAAISKEKHMSRRQYSSERIC